MSPLVTMTDFEQALINAITNVFGSKTETKTCFYHLTQSTWHKIQSLGIVSKYKEDKFTRHF